jgi:hypothetical protein
MKFNSNKTWYPCSTDAYGGHAVYIPEYGKPGAIEFILMMNQNYPEFKTHPALDVSHGYVQGVERFKHNHDYRVVPWEIDPEYKSWSFLYLPTFENNVRAVATFVPTADSGLRLYLELENPGPTEREWEFFMYISAHEKLELSDCSHHLSENSGFEFSLAGTNFTMESSDVGFTETVETDSNFWINFPLNVEMTCHRDGWKKRGKQRLKLSMTPVVIPANGNKAVTIDFLPENCAGNKLPARPEKRKVRNAELPFVHHQWQMLHNIQYVPSFRDKDVYEIRYLPARQWGRFFIWDMGLAVSGAAEFDNTMAEHILDSMPDPEVNGCEVFKHGSYIITAVFGLWELVRATGSFEPVSKYYRKLCRLALKMFDQSGGAPVISGCGADDSPALFYAKGWIFNWEFKKTLPTNPERKPKKMYCTGLAGYGISILKILRDLGSQARLDTAEVETVIERGERFLMEHHWNDEDACFYDVLAETDCQLKIPWIYDFLPLLSDSVPEDQRINMFRILLDKYFIPKRGFCIEPPDSEFYRNEGYPNGSAWPPLQYFFWKICYAIGDMEAAKMIADTWLEQWEKHHRQSLGNWEQFRIDTGAPAGNYRFIGFTSPVLNMHTARRVFGTVQTAFDIILKDREISRQAAKLTLSSNSYTGRTGISIVLEPYTDYRILNQGRESIQKSDRYGYLAFAISIEAAQEVTILMQRLK